MDTELGTFERKLMQLVETCHRLRSDNQRLRHELSESRNEVREVQERIEGARTRLEKLVEQIPDEMP
jgi:cell division protein ZapB